MSSIGSNQSSKRWELVSIAECESSGLLVTFFMAWSPGRRFNDGDSRVITPETKPPSIPTNPATGPRRAGTAHGDCHRRMPREGGRDNFMESRRSSHAREADGKDA